MLTLVLIRHAKSLHDAYVKADSERHLSPRGYDDALQSALWCKKNGLVPDLILSSPAIRAYTTSFIFANCYGYQGSAISLNPSIYGASAQKLLYVINELNFKYKTVFMFGHNPGFSDLVNLLCGPAIAHLPTAGVAQIEFNDSAWPAVHPGSGNLKAIFSSHKEVE